MEYSRSLRSLEVRGRSFGTERPASSPGNEQQTRFERELERAHRAKEPQEEVRPEREDETERIEAQEPEPERAEESPEAEEAPRKEPQERAADSDDQEEAPSPIETTDSEDPQEQPGDSAELPQEAPAEATQEAPVEQPAAPLGDWLSEDELGAPTPASLQDPVLAEDPTVLEPVAPPTEEAVPATERTAANRGAATSAANPGEANPVGPLTQAAAGPASDPAVQKGQPSSPDGRASATDGLAERPQGSSVSATQPNAQASAQDQELSADPETAFEPLIDDEAAAFVGREEVDSLRPVRTAANANASTATASTAAPAAVRSIDGAAVRPVAEAGQSEAAPPPRADVDKAADILRQVRLQISADKRQALIQLEPKNLGRIAVRMAMRDGRLTAVLQVERPETLRALERQAPELKAALGAQNIETESFDMMLGFGRDEAGAQAGDGRSHGHESGSRFNDLFDEGVEAVEPGSALARRIVGEGGVDTYV